MHIKSDLCAYCEYSLEGLNCTHVHMLLNLVFGQVCPLTGDIPACMHFSEYESYWILGRTDATAATATVHIVGLLVGMFRRKGTCSFCLCTFHVSWLAGEATRRSALL